MSNVMLWTMCHIGHVKSTYKSCMYPLAFELCWPCYNPHAEWIKKRSTHDIGATTPIDSRSRKVDERSKVMQWAIERRFKYIFFIHIYTKCMDRLWISKVLSIGVTRNQPQALIDVDLLIMYILGITIKKIEYFLDQNARVVLGVFLPYIDHGYYCVVTLLNLCLCPWEILAWLYYTFQEDGTRWQVMITLILFGWAIGNDLDVDLLSMISY